MIWINVALALGMTLRLSRIVTTDSLGQWLFVHPATDWAIKNDGSMSTYEDGSLALDEEQGWRSKLVSGLDCPFCIGFHLGWLVLLSLWLVGGPVDAAQWWQWIAGAFTLNYVVGHIASRLD